MKKLRVLLSEGSSLTAREIVTCLGPLGYELEILDGNPFCLARFSRWVRRVHKAPAAGADPRGYLERLREVVETRQPDVVFPTHEQARLIAANVDRTLPVAVARVEAFERVQSKLAFAGLLDELGLPQPTWFRVKAAADISDMPFPYWLKSEFGTAGQAVRFVRDAASRDSALLALLVDERELIAQRPADGQYAQAQGLFDEGRLIAAHTSVQVGIGVGGSAAARVSVDHPAARRSLAALGEEIGWHGGLTLDYLHVGGRPSFIECNPRTVEPANAAASGVNLADLQVATDPRGEVRGPAETGAKRSQNPRHSRATTRSCRSRSDASLSPSSLAVQSPAVSPTPDRSS